MRVLTDSDLRWVAGGNDSQPSWFRDMYDAVSDPFGTVADAFDWLHAKEAERATREGEERNAEIQRGQQQAPVDPVNNH